MKKLYEGFDLCAPSTSVSMTINGPAPIILAMFMNTAIDQQVRIKEEELGRALTVEEFTEVKEGTTASCSRNGASGYSERRPRAKYMYLLDGICASYDGRYSAILHRSKSAELLLCFDFWLSYCRSRRESDFTACIHAGKWLHIC